MSDSHQPLHLKKKPAGGNTDEKPSPHLGARTLGLRGGDKRGGGGGPSELLRSAVEKSAMARSSFALSSRAASANPDRSMNSPSPNPSAMSPSPSPLSPFNPLSPANAASPGLYDLNPAPLPASVAQVQPFAQPAQPSPQSQLLVSMQQPQPVAAVSGALSALDALTAGPRKPFTRNEAIDSDDKEKEGADSQKASGEDAVSTKVDLYPSPSPQPTREELLRQEVLSSTGRVRDLVLNLDLARGSSVVPVLELVKNNLNQCVWVLEQEQDEPAPRSTPVPFSALGEAARRSSSKHLDIVKQLQEVEASEVRANLHLTEEQPLVDKAPFLKSLSKQDLSQHTVTRDYDSPRLGARSIKDSPLVARRGRPEAPAPVGGPPTSSSRAMHQKRMDPAASVAAALREEEAIEQKLPPQRDVMSDRPPNPLRSPQQHSVDSDTDNDSDEESQHAETITVHARTPVPGPRAAQSDLLPLRRAEIEAANALAASNSAAARNSARMSRIFNASASLLDNEKSSVNAESAASEGLDRSALPKINAIGSGVTEDYNSPDISSRRLRSRQLSREREAATKDSKPQPSARAAAAGGPSSSRAVTSHSASVQPLAQQQPQQQAASQPEIVNLRGSVEGLASLGLGREPVVLSVKESPFLSMDRLRDRLLRDGDLEYAGKKQRKVPGDQDVDSVVASAAVPAPIVPSGLAVAVRRPSERIDVGITDSPPSSPKEFAALRLRSFAKEDLELQDQQAAKAREETPRPTFLRRIDLSGDVDAVPAPVAVDPTAEKDRRQIVELLDRIFKLTSSLHHLTPQSLEQVRVLLQLSLQKVETVSTSTTN